MSEETELLKELIKEIKGLRADTVSQESVSTSQEKIETAKQSSRISEVNLNAISQNTLGNFQKFSGALQGGDIRNIGSAAGQVLGGSKGGFLAGAAGEVASLFGPRGYNAFNVFEKYDATVVKPFQQVEQIAYEYGKYGKELPDDVIKSLFEGGKAAEERGYKQRERVRGLIDTNAISSKISDLGGGWIGDFAKSVMESLSTGTKNFMSSEEKTMNIAKKTKKMQKALERQDKFDDDY